VTTLAANQSFTVAVTVSGSSGTPTGTVSLTSGSYIALAGTLSGGKYSFNIPANSLAAGTATLDVDYSGDATYAEASGSASVTVTKLTPTVTVQPDPTSVGAQTTSVSVKVTVSGAGATPTGTAQLTVNSYSSSCALAGGTCSISVPSSKLSNGTDTLTVNYSGDSVYSAATGAATITVNILTPAVSVTPSPSTLTTTGSTQVAIKVTGSGPMPSGTVTLTGGSYSSGPQALVAGAATLTVPGSSLIAGPNVLTASYSGDSVYIASAGTATVTVNKVTPTLTIVPASASIVSNTSLEITGAVSGSGATPSGSIVVSSGGYTSGSIPLANGKYSVTIPAGVLAAGSDTLSATYSGDAVYNGATATAAVTVTQFTKIAPTVTVTPATAAISTGQSLGITIAVSGTSGTPTGSVTLSGGSYTSPGQPLSNGGASITIPAGSLVAGTNTLTATYAGDPTYNGATGSASVTVTQAVFTVSASTPTSISGGGTAKSIISVATSTGYSGTVALTCTLNAGGPTNQSGDAPTCSIPSTAVSMGGTATATVSTVAATTGAIQRPALPGRGLFGGAVLALLLFAGIPARHRTWRSTLGALVLLIVLGGLAACGGVMSGTSGGGNGGGATMNPGTASGSYTFTVTGTGDPAVTPAPTTTFTVTVN
jgi:hypothetical protein